MTIVYFITTVGHGKGGHFHSLNTIANAVGKTEDVHVINVGVKPSEVLNGSDYKFIFVPFNGLNFVATYFKLSKIIDQIKPDAIHAFDVESFAFSRLFSKRNKQPSFLNKCGGPNPKKYFPKSDQLILFSKENKAYFEGNSRYNNTKTTVVANRVKPVVIDTSRVKQFYDLHGNADLSLLRIARIGKHYKTSIIQAISLLYWLKSKGLKARLIILGTIQSDAVYDSIIQYIKLKELEDDIAIETSDAFTYNASELLEIGDVVIGTGRNFMEASSLNKVLLVPYKNSDYPLLVTDGNFQDIFKTNFSPRTEVKNFNEAENLSTIFELLKNRNQTTNSITWFDTYFNVDKAVEQYVKLYNEKLSRKSHAVDAVINIMYAIKTFVLKT